jgi:hypothetical protein
MAKRLGIGATCSVGERLLHPKRLRNERFSSTTPKQHLSGLLSLRKESKKLNGKNQCCVVFPHDDYPNIELFCQERWCKVDKEGPKNSLFDSSEEADVALQEGTAELQLPSEAVGAAEDIVFFRAAGFDVDDDNDSAPENIPGVEGETVPDTQTWGWNGICYQKLTGLADHPAKMVGCNDVDLMNMTMLNMFLFFFPSQFLHEVLLLQLNKSLQEQKECPCGIGEFIQFIGLWFYMTTFKGFNRSEYWSLKEIDDFDGAPI